MGAIIIRMVIGSLATLCGVAAFVKIFKKNKRIDTESIAVVKEVQDLGRDYGRKIYAIRYDVQAKEPFELLSTPCKKLLRPGAERCVFYEKEDPKNNYYFKLIGQFDRRFIMPCSVIFCGLITIVSAIVELF